MGFDVSVGVTKPSELVRMLHERCIAIPLLAVVGILVLLEREAQVETEARDLAGQVLLRFHDRLEEREEMI